MIRPSLLLALALGLAACSSVEPADAPAGPLPDASLYHLDATWTTEAGATVTLADFRGRPTVVAMIYAHCAYACPLIVQDMRRTAAELDDPDAARFVLVSFDPDRDTPAVLRRFKEAHGLPDSWILLRSDANNVRMLAALLGISYRPEADGQIAHSNLITVLDRDGEIAGVQESLGKTPEKVVQALEGLLAAR